MFNLKSLTAAALVALLAGCVSPPPAHDYTAFKEADPHSIIILPPLNNTPEVIAPYSVMTQMVAPIAESGFYVFPVAVVEQTFKGNGLTVASDVHQVPVDKLQSIFGADSALYITVEEYGTSYVVISSETAVTVSASLVDLRTGVQLWQGKARASSAEQQNNSGGGLVGMLVVAAINQIAETITDKGFEIAAITSNRLLSSDTYNGLLYGPRSPSYGQPVPSEKKK
ncbi:MULTISPECIES: DUF799 domain-containing protein [unclassified Pseudoalteromonas]|uniref:DUF799 domain-containing protein n=1 Tax=unclassified Pseudoalteromonas TaxID=194690 RepID=UPI000731F971|nr:MULTISPECIES: DUF799 domain-containing protein [unclassified Pseudoalteromonas]KTF19348.1 hypothetical protein ATS76_01600 [Pseudoalteromonas sp. 10-33]MBW4964887.1 DUF799 domain-containing protein [Pseudoalteromonas sp. CR1]TMN86062.1 pantothenate kinase [Pseudoalteromonas sp. S410]TMN93388.1 pantothenate kinase [Pseudoalteromonas sp. S408]TMN99881.1 pantothenate kinase [Pseudoalteromonas sp. S407]